MKKKSKTIQVHQKTRDQCFRMALASAEGGTAEVTSNQSPAASAVEARTPPRYRLH